jgi:MSHA biogenesis protein MshO
MMTNTRVHAAPGWTLVEAIVVVVLSGVVAAVVATFIRAPVLGYVDAARRAELTDAADTALRRITRDLRAALPNSVRVKAVGSVVYLEYLETAGAGRYRQYPDAAGAGDPLDFSAADGSFDVIGPMPALASGDAVVVFNANSEDAVALANAYAGDNRARYVSSTASTVTIEAASGAPGTPVLFPYMSPGRRFHVVRQPVTYVCDPTVGVQQVRRYWGYAIQPAQPTTFAPGTASALLADGVTACAFAYTVSPATQRVGVVSVEITLMRGDESVRLFQQVHVNDVP